jgi:hypothetical protein
MKSNDENDIIPLELPKLNLPLVNKERKSDDDFMSDLIQVANEVNKAIIVALGIVPQKKIELEKLDVIKGYLVRLYKLYDSYIFLIVKRRTEIAFIILRTLTETVINLEYLLKHNLTDVYKKYKRASLAYENNLQETILKNVLNRGDQLPIEERMLKSIKDTFIRSGMKNIEEKELKKTKWGLKKEDLEISGKAKDVELEPVYRSIFTFSSHFVHGSWHELDFYHLDKELDSYGGRQPQMKYGTPKPQLIEAISILVLSVLSKYLSTITEDGEHSTEVKAYLEKISSWFMEMVNKHEEFLQLK